MAVALTRNGSLIVHFLLATWACVFTGYLFSNVPVEIEAQDLFSNVPDETEAQEDNAFQYLYYNRSYIDESKPNITIGFFTSFSGIGKLIAGAVPIAVQKVNEDPKLLPNHTLQFVAADSGEPNTPLIIRKMTQMREQGVAGFIGPDHSCVSEALVAAAWYLPMITYKCSDPRLSDKKVFSTFARTLPPSSKVSKSVISLLKHFEWDRVTLLVAENPSDTEVAEALEALAEQHGIFITDTIKIPGWYLRSDNSTLKAIIQETYMKTRIYVTVAEHTAVVDFVRIMHEMNLLEGGEYIIISVAQEEAYDPNKEFQYIRREFEAVYESEIDPVPFRSVLLISTFAPINADYELFQEAVTEYSSEEPFNVNFHPVIRVEVPIYAGLLYDAVMIYATALTKALAENKSELDGEAIFAHIRSQPYESILGFSVMIDEFGDAEGNYTVLALIDDEEGNFSGPVSGKMQPVARFTHRSAHDLPQLNIERSISWVAGQPPKSNPKCGFNGDKCIYKPDWKLISICTVCGFVIFVVGIFVFRHYRYEHKLACLLWKVEMKDLILLRSDHEGTPQHLRNTINELESGRFSNVSEPTFEDPVTGRTQSHIGFYKGNAVYIYHVYKKSIDLSRSLRKEMIQIREMRHENINPFIGACVDPPNICILTLFCARGSLEDVLKNVDLHLDTMFIASLVADLVKGMVYIHDSEIMSHGNLKSSNCVIDSRWVLKITDFGLHEFKAGQDYPPYVDEKYNKRVLWRAPELLRMINLPPRGTQKGDVYSFGIILYEIIGRKGPWGEPRPSVKYVQERVTNPHQYGGKLYRPPTEDLPCADYLRKCMEECWEEDPDLRPDFRFIKIKLRELHSGLNTNIFDNMINMMEKYAYNLESVVKDRTKQLLEEKKKTENLLLRMLPKPVAEQLLRGEQVQAESFDSVTIYFSDIVGFTSLSAVSTPLQVVDLLNDLYTCFDSIIGNYDVYKVETIGDAYMVVSGLPIRNGDRHAGEIASLALRLLDAIRTFEIRHRPNERLSLRIGINSGPCVAGVVGQKMPRYCLFGDTVNTASRMESTGEALKIHVSEACKIILDKLGGYILQERGLTYIKGKGDMRTYWLIGKDSSNNISKADISDIPKATADCNCSPRHHNCLTSPPLKGSPIARSPLLKESEEHYTELLARGTESSLCLGESDWLKDKNLQLSNSNFNSCLSLIQEHRKNFGSHLKKEPRNGYIGIQSAPIISFREFYSSPQDTNDYIL